MRDVSLGFTEPYFLDRPLQLGFVVYLRRFNFDQGREASILSGTNLIPLYNAARLAEPAELLAEQPRVLGLGQLSAASAVSPASGVTYGFDISDIVTRRTGAAQAYFEYINFSGVGGTEFAERHPHQPHHPVLYLQHGQSSDHARPPDAACSLSTDFAGSFLGGNVNTIRPTIDVKYFKQAPWHRSHILAFHGMGSLITGYGGKFVAAVLPHLHRRRTGCPRFRDLGHQPDRVCRHPARPSTCLNDDGTPRTQKVIIRTASSASAPVTMKIPTYQLDHARRRHAGGGQLRVPHPDRRAGDAGAVRRFRHRTRSCVPAS